MPEHEGSKGSDSSKPSGKGGVSAKLDEEAIRVKWERSISSGQRPSATIKGGPARLLESRRIRPRQGRLGSGKSPASEELDYELAEVLGRGGMGVVFVAEQKSVGRKVALKMMLPAAQANDAQREGFLSEAAIASDLDHPNVAPVYELGKDRQGRLFYTMKRIRGERWSDVMAKRSRDENLDILMRVADAVAFAHSKGVLHRDIKPDNVMLGGFGETMLIDWGIAAQLGQGGQAEGITQTAVSGTPAYMPPETAKGDAKRIGPWSDQYLLGAVLYQIVTGRPPHAGATAMECVMAAAKNRIAPAEKKGELLSIALKAMATDPKDRYASVQDFQEAIRAYRSHLESVVLSRRARKQLEKAEGTGDYADYRRALAVFEESLELWPGNRAAKSGVAESRLAYARCAFGRRDLDLAASLLVEGEADHAELAGQVASAKRERDRRRRLFKGLVYSSASLAAAVFVVLTAAFFMIRAEQRRTEAERQRTAEERDRAVAAEREAAAERDAAVREGYSVKIALAHRRIQDNEIRSAQNLLAECPEPLRHWEWGFLKGMLRQELRAFSATNPVRAVAASPDGRSVAAAMRGGRIQIRDVESGEQRLLFPAHQREAFGLAYHPDGSMIVSCGGDGMVRLWKSDSGEALAAMDGHKGDVHDVAFSPDGSLIASCGEDGTVRTWDGHTGRSRHVMAGDGPIRSLAWKPDGSGLVTLDSSERGQGRLWDVASGKQVAEFPMGGLYGYDVAFDPAGARIVAFMRRHEDGVRVMDAADGSALATWGAPGRGGMALSFSPDGSNLAAWRRDSSIELLDAETGAILQTFRGHLTAGHGLDFFPDSKHFVTGGGDRTVRIWDATGTDPNLLTPARCNSIALSPDGRRLLAGHDRGAFRSWDLETRQLVFSAQAGTLRIESVTYGPPGNSYAAVASSGGVWLVDAENGAVVRKLYQPDERVRSVAFSPDGEFLAVGGDDAHVRFVRLEDGKEFAAFGPPPVPEDSGLADTWGRVRGVIFAQDGRSLFVNRRNLGVTTLDLGTAEESYDEGRTRHYSFDFDLSEDGLMLAEPRRQQIHVWGAKDGETLHYLQGHSVRVESIAFSPDGLRLASGDLGGLVILWDVEQGRELLRFQAHAGNIREMAFTPDGRRLVSASHDGMRVWEAVSLEEEVEAAAPAAAGELDDEEEEDGE